MDDDSKSQLSSDQEEGTGLEAGGMNPESGAIHFGSVRHAKLNKPSILKGWTAQLSSSHSERQSPLMIRSSKHGYISKDLDSPPLYRTPKVGKPSKKPNERNPGNDPSFNVDTAAS
ncbi:hypothetical protein CYLTODRAFT_415524 [Cylindrobasidium torrendii FP15055 ss-10]|uniref:Uncharacterized protein n=1 Tax=Cylindrobasidium torrendii FP15055 ss-10 TaxID=1314674 RepID=A0A0D7ASX8_9AGAR|nr:hypothetical protein CYLTODRAFT_415524 [Cylindrobasidium torrendii FP15055 ss-10]